MKRMYEMPMAYEEAFVANEYVSACGYWTDSQGKLHGLCGYDGDKHSGTYSHIGRLNITNIDDHHPNHS